MVLSNTRWETKLLLPTHNFVIRIIRRFIRLNSLFDELGCRCSILCVWFDRAISTARRRGNLGHWLIRFILIGCGCCCRCLMAYSYCSCSVYRFLYRNRTWRLALLWITHCDGGRFMFACQLLAPYTVYYIIHYVRKTALNDVDPLRIIRSLKTPPTTQRLKTIFINFRTNLK